MEIGVMVCVCEFYSVIMFLRLFFQTKGVLLKYLTCIYSSYKIMVIKSFEIEQTHVLWLQQIEKRLVKQCRQSIDKIS